jgi:hypothetical protein
MSKAVRAVVIALVFVVAGCAGGGGKDRATEPTTTSTVAPTTQPTPTTLSQEDQVKAAYLAYWQMVDRLIATPDAGDSEIEKRAVDPVLSSLRDDLQTREAQGRSTRAPSDSRYEHEIQRALLTDNEASIDDCFIDDRVQYSSDGAVLNDRVSTVHASAQLTFSDGWKVSDVRTERIGDASVGCA